jgi:hypothetical protein
MGFAIPFYREFLKPLALASSSLGAIGRIKDVLYPMNIHIPCQKPCRKTRTISRVNLGGGLTAQQMIFPSGALGCQLHDV